MTQKIFQEAAGDILDEFGIITSFVLSDETPISCLALIDKARQADMADSEGVLKAELNISVLRDAFEKELFVNEEIEVGGSTYYIRERDNTGAFLNLKLIKTED